MSCQCSTLKTNVTSGAIYGMSKLAMSKSGKEGKKAKNKIIMDSAVFALSGIVYDKMRESIVPMAGGYIQSEEMMKSVYQLIIMEGYGFLLKGEKLKANKILSEAVSVLVANYGPDLLNSVQI